MSAPALKELEESIYDVLTAIGRRPGMYCGGSEPSLTWLEGFLSGYTGGLARVGFALKGNAEFGRFNDWEIKRLGFSDHMIHWAELIRQSCKDDREAFQKFFALLDEFRSQSK